ncbi:hypothetical protein DFJ43DRAFT_1119276 [Lentinula guzmanii]|uniref:C2 domain-containing protein n=1 Tax=Lentinula guzmanii TaxID=2804957 RepID=A0AA38JKK5_9AGAR|nr:hypothetical protein DFJ43DRAFT_1119276 [Lentinula guzmanii]
MSGEEEIGTLIIVVLKAQNLNDKHFFKQDVYAQLSLNGTTKKTKIDYKGGQHPVWDSELRFPIMKNTAKKFRELEVSCYAKEHRDDSLLGEAKVDMTPTLKSGEFDEWVPLQVNAVQRGEIYLEITYYSNGPAPPQSSLLAPPTSNLTRRPSKMSAADRLYRPTSSVNLHATAQQQQGNRTPPKEGSLPMPGSYTPAPVPSTIKPGPNAVPNNLKPGPATVPSTLKPGPVAATAPGTHTTGHVLYPTSNPYTSSAPAPSINYNPNGPLPYTSSTPAPSTNYNPNGAVPLSSSTSVPSGSGPIPYASSTPLPSSNANYNRNDSLPYPSNATPTQPYTHRQSSNPSILDWNSNTESTGTLSFPVPNFPSAPSVATGPPTNGYGNGFHSQLYQSGPPPVHQRTASFSHAQQPARTSSGDLPDPYLIARYQTPLPLPPETHASTSSSSSSYTHRRTASAEPTTYRPAPPLPAHPSHTSRSTSHNLNIPLSPPPPEPSRSRTPVDETRLQALRQAEQEAARRREQEERDAELARVLDQEEAEREERERVQQREQQRQRELEKARVPPKSTSPPPYVKLETERKSQEDKDAELARQLDRELNLS